MSERAILRRFNYRHEAEVVRSVLAGVGIEATVTSDDCGSVDPALGLVRGVCVAVCAKDLERAEEVLNAPAAEMPGRTDWDEVKEPPA